MADRLTADKYLTHAVMLSIGNDNRPCPLRLHTGLWITRNYSPERNLNAKVQRQDGSQICMFHVDCDIGMPVRIGYIQAKLVITSAT